MLSFHGDKKIKTKYITRVKAHRIADNLIRGEGWTGTKGCAVGCTLEAYDHSRYPTELGIPEWLARVEDSLFEGMSIEKSKTWPEVFLKSIPVGVDLEPIKPKFMILILEHALESMYKAQFDREKNPSVVTALTGSEEAVKNVIKLWKKKKVTEQEWSAAESAARSAARSARSAAESAAWSAAESAWSAAWSAARSAWSAAESAAYDYYADRLIEMLKDYK